MMVTAENILMAFFSVVAFVAVIFLYYIYNRYEDLTEQSREQERQILSLKALQENYEKQEKISRHYGELLHNLKYYLMLIGSYADEGKNEEILRVLKDLQVEISSSQNTIYCDNKLFNFILQEWENKARDIGCVFEVKADPFFCLPMMTEIDMFGLFGNLFDNALEAVQRISSGSIEVELLLRRNGEIAIVRIRNSYGGMLEMQNGGIKTSKADKVMHGIGLKSVERLIKKYGGIFQIETQGNIFEIKIVFHL